MIKIGFDFDNGRKFNPLKYIAEISAIISDVWKCADDAVFMCDNSYAAEMISIACEKFNKSYVFIDNDGNECSEDEFFMMFSKPFREFDLHRVLFNDKKADR